MPVSEGSKTISNCTIRQTDSNSAPKSPAKRRIRLSSHGSAEAKNKDAKPKEQIEGCELPHYDNRNRFKKDNVLLEVDCNRERTVLSNEKEHGRASCSPQAIKGMDKRIEKIVVLKSNWKQHRLQVSRKLGKKLNSREAEGNEQFDRLLEITSRCVDYYNKFAEEKDIEIKVVRGAFQEISQSLYAAFYSIIKEVEDKYEEIAKFLAKKQLELLMIKQEQEVALKNNLENIKTIHLTNLLKGHEDQTSTAEFKVLEKEEASQEISKFANTLHQFYEAMEKVENLNFKETVDDTINFINNLITEELKFIVYDRIPQKSANCSFSFNEGMGIASSRAAQGDPSYVSSTFELDDKKLEAYGLLKPSTGNILVSFTDGWCQTIPSQPLLSCSPLDSLTQIVGRQAELRKRMEWYQEFV